MSQLPLSSEFNLPGPEDLRSVQPKVFCPSSRSSPSRIVVVDEPLPEPEAEAPPVDPTWTLPQFCGWYERHKLRARPSTMLKYRDAMKWWAAILGGLAIQDVRTPHVARFVAGLRSEYQRGPRGQMRRLSAQTQHDHAVNAAVLLRSLRELGIVPPDLQLPTVAAPDAQPKDAYTLPTARAIAAACSRMHWGHKRSEIPAPIWWRAWIALCLYTGFRRGTVQVLRAEWIVTRNGLVRLDVPAESATKKHRFLTVALHPQCLQAIAALRPWIGDTGLLLPYPKDPGYVIDDHAELQTLAGIYPTLPPQAWRRTHGVWMETFGFEADKLRLAQSALGHSSPEITASHYASPADHARLAFPDLWPDGLPTADPGPAQLRLF